MAETNNIEKKSYLITQNDLNGKTERILNSFQLYHVGICNRIKQLFTNMRLHAGEYDTVNIHWPVKGRVTSRFYDLFNFEGFQRINEINYSVYLDNKYYEEATWRLFLKSAEFQELRQFGLNYIDFEFHNIPQPFIDLYKPYFLALKPSKYVKEVMDTIHLPEKCVAVHFRHSSDWKEYNRWGDDDINQFFKEMHKYSDDTYFYVACPDQGVHDAVIEEFKERALFIDMNYANVDNVKDVAELFLLSKCDKLIGTYGSTFTECAWWLSGCNQEVTIIGSDETWKNGGLPDWAKK